MNQSLLNFTNQSSTILDELVTNRTRKLARIETIEDELNSLEFLLNLICKELFNSSNCTLSNKTNEIINSTNDTNENNTSNNTSNDTSNNSSQNTSSNDTSNNSTQNTSNNTNTSSNTSNNTDNNTNNNSNNERANLSNFLPGDTSTEEMNEEPATELGSSEESDNTPSNEEQTKEFIELSKNIKNIQSFLFEKPSSFDINSIIQNNNELKEEYFSSDLVSIIEGFISNHTFDQLMIWKIKILLLRLKHYLIREKRKILRNILRLNQTITNTNYEFDLNIEKVNTDISDTTAQIKLLQKSISDLKSKITDCDGGIAKKKDCDNETKDMMASIQKLEEERKIVEKVAKLINYL